MFIFISGFLLARRYPVKRQQRKSFIYKSKDTQDIPIVSACACYICLFIVPGPFDLLSFAAHTFSLNLLLSPLTGTPIFTLWFVGLIFSYYLLFPLVINSSDKLFRTATLLALILGILSLLHKYLGIIDERMIIYLPIFFIGVYFGRNGLIPLLHNKIVVRISTCILVPSFYYNLMLLQDIFNTA